MVLFSLCLIISDLVGNNDCIPSLESSDLENGRLQGWIHDFSVGNLILRGEFVFTNR